MNDRCSIRVAEPVARRSRRSAPRSKTGCLTCRKRRVKCDETGPPCKKCIALQLDCKRDTRDTTESKQNHPISAKGSLPHPCSGRGPDWRFSPTNIEATRQEVRIFDLFRKIFIRRIGGPIDQPIWTYDILQAAQTQPCIWHSCLAIAAMFDPTASKKQHGGSKLRSNSSFLLGQYAKSLSAMRHSMDNQGDLTYSQQGSLLMSSFLLAGLCSLMLSWSEGLTHIEYATKLYLQWGYRGKAIRERDNASRGPIRGVYISSTMAIFEIKMFPIMSQRYKAEWTAHIDIKPCSNTPYQSSTDAFYEVQPLFHGFLRAMLSSNYGTQDHPSELTLMLCRQLEQWTQKYGVFQTSKYYDCSSVEATILATNVIVVQMLARLCCNQTDVDHPDYLDQYHQLTAMMQSTAGRDLVYSRTVGPSSPVLNYSSDLGYVASIAISCCPSRSMQKSIIRLMASEVDATIAGIVHNKIFDMEDSYLSRAAEDSTSACACLPPDTLCTMHRVVYCSANGNQDDAVIVRLFTRHDIQHAGQGREILVDVRQ